MKTISSILITGMFLGCGIVSLFFPPPDRYIYRDVKPEELTGTWQITAESQSIVDEFIIRYPDFPIAAPYETITLNADGFCLVHWLKKLDFAMRTGLLGCKWEIKKSSYTTGKDISLVEFAFEYFGNYTAYRSLNIFEENGELILWKYVGDPDDAVPQEFKKVTVK